jgi:HD-GYP domain-containing protein (c-di-GMP phosphodiesterase class II)
MKREYLVLLTGPLQGTERDIVGSLTIGRSPENGLQLNDLQVSRKHAVVQQTPAGTIVRDLGSGNGTYIGDRRILEYRLADGDVIRIGPVDLKFELRAGDVMTTPRPLISPLATSDPRQSVRFHAEEAGSKVEANAADSVYQTFFKVQQNAVSTDQLRDAQNRLAAVYKANQIISSERDLRKLFERVMDQIFGLVPAHNGVILLKDERTGELVTEYVKRGDRQSEVAMSSSIVSRAFDNGEAVITYNAASDSRFEAGASIISQNISSAMCTPLQHQNETLGIIYVDTRGTQNAFAQGDLELLVALAGPAATAIRNAQYVAELEKAYQDTLIVLANAIELRDHYTVGHTWRVTNFAIEIARKLDWPEEKLRECEMGGVVHDVGKISIDDAVLRKPGGLTDEEYAQMRVHPERGARMMQDIKMLVPLIPYALYHHERFDGNGYPFGLAGEDIPIEGRLLAVADTLDAMTSNRPYRKGFDPEYAISEIEKGRGSQFDPTIVDALMKCYREGKIDRILQDYHKKDEKSIACPFCSTYVRLPDLATVDFEFQCGVCHRQIRLKRQNEAYFGELIARNEPTPLSSGPTGESATADPEPAITTNERSKAQD